MTSKTGDPIRLDRPLELDDVPTPALLIDLEAFERNLEKMAGFAAGKGIDLRPHTKTHKSPYIAKRQIERGAVGVCTAKVSEAEVMIDAGVKAVLVTSPIVSAEKIERFVALAKRSDELRIVVDNQSSAEKLDQAGRETGTELGVLVDLDPGIRRTGIAPGEPALDLVERIAQLDHLRFDGLQAYAGHVMHVEGWHQRALRSEHALADCIATRRLLEDRGHRVEIFTGGGTGTFDIDCEGVGFTDLQVGSYLFMDVEYRRIGGQTGELLDDFAPSLFVLSTAISQPVRELITIDAGYKSLATDTVKPALRDWPEVAFHWGGDEHGMLGLGEPPADIGLGDKLQVMVPHCDPTVNLYDYYHPYRDGRVTELWPISGRGKSQ